MPASPQSHASLVFPPNDLPVDPAMPAQPSIISHSRDDSRSPSLTDVSSLPQSDISESLLSSPVTQSSPLTPSSEQRQCHSPFDLASSQVSAFTLHLPPEVRLMMPPATVAPEMKAYSQEWMTADTINSSHVVPPSSTLEIFSAASLPTPMKPCMMQANLPDATIDDLWSSLIDDVAWEFEFNDVTKT